MYDADPPALAAPAPRQAASHTRAQQSNTFFYRNKLESLAALVRSAFHFARPKA